MLKKTALILAAVFMAAAMPAIPAKAAALETDEITIYHLSADYAEELTVPEGCPESWQIRVTDAERVTYRLGSGRADIEVSEDGLITCAPSHWYWYGGYGYSYPLEGQTADEITERMNYGDRIIQVTADGETYPVTVHVVDYAEQYYQDVLDKAAAAIGDDLKGAEKLDAVGRYVAGYDYDYHYSFGKDMVIHGGGDCWASVDVVNALCAKLGIQSWTRNANLDFGAGSGHRNVIAYVDGKYYQVDAGYGGTAPRSYSVKERASLWSYRVTNSTDKTATITQYDGRDGDLTVPAEIDGYTVTSLNQSCFYRNSDNYTLTSVTLPDTIERVGNYAFYGTGVTEVTLPASVKEIGLEVFGECGALKKITVLSPDCVFTEDEEEGTTIFSGADVLICGHTGSTAEAYAKAHEIRFRALDAAPIPGDADDDGDLDTADIVLMQRWLLAVPETFLAGADGCDMDGNGVLDILDLGLMKRQLLA